ncbi:MAG: response regulator transcription factor [Thermotogota bacterium]
MKILLVEDDDSLATGIMYALGKENWKIESVINKKQALEKINNNSYDFFLLDIMLPDGNGFEICEHIRKEKDSPIIFLTARDEEVNIIKGLDMGADDYITKPFSIGELTSRIKAIYRRVNNKNNDLLDFGNIRINLSKQEVKRNGELVKLTPTEFKILNILCLNSLKVMSKEKIIQSLYDAVDEMYDENTLSVYIRRLREKIEENPSKPKLIKTIRGLGYKFDKRRV